MVGYFENIHGRCTAMRGSRISGRWGLSPLFGEFWFEVRKGVSQMEMRHHAGLLKQERDEHVQDEERLLRGRQ